MRDPVIFLSFLILVCLWIDRDVKRMDAKTLGRFPRPDCRTSHVKKLPR